MAGDGGRKAGTAEGRIEGSRKGKSVGRNKGKPWKMHMGARDAKR